MPIIKSGVNNWTSVKYDNNITDKDDEFRFLSTFEELTDYDLQTPPAASSVTKSTTKEERSEGKKKKRKTENVDHDDEARNSDSGEDAAPEVIMSKKKRRKTIKKKSSATKQQDEIINAETSDNGSDSPECDISAWRNLFVPESVLRALKYLRFSRPTPIQSLALPAAIRDRLDILGAAETGSGKTLAFGIPIIAGLLVAEEEESGTLLGPKALILSPTRELALQIKQHLTAVLKFADKIKISCVIGGLSIQKQERLMKRNPQILIATPGRLWASIKEGFEYLKDIGKTVRYLAIDETDRMMEMGHFGELSSILEILREDQEASKKRQTFAFSATLTYVHPPPKRLMTAKQAKLMSQKDKINMLISFAGLRKQNKVIDVTRQLGTAEGLTETRLNCGSLLEKDTYLYYFLTLYPGRTLVFTNSVDCSSRLRSLLACLRFDPLILNARMHQKQRLKNLERFSGKEKSLLLATDVAARGLDIRNIDHVIHYQVPRTPEIYVHRSGRTARSSQQGLSVMLVDPKDVSFYRRICKNLNRDKDLDIFPLQPKGLEMARDVVQLATQLESLEHKTKKSQGSQKWFRKAAKEADLEESSDEERFASRPKYGDEDDDSKNSKIIKSLRGRLNSLLSIPVKIPAPVTKYPAAYQLTTATPTMNIDSAGGNTSKQAIEAVNVAKVEEQKLVKKYGLPKVKVDRKRSKAKQKAGKKRKSVKKGKKVAGGGKKRR